MSSSSAFRTPSYSTPNASSATTRPASSSHSSSWTACDDDDDDALLIPPGLHDEEDHGDTRHRTRAAPLGTMRAGSARERARYLDQLHDQSIVEDRTTTTTTTTTTSNAASTDSGAARSATSAPPPPLATNTTHTTSPPRRRTRGIQDLKSKTCWVCYEESSETPDREFVHACDCTLVAHTDCLLAWVTTDQINKRTPACCPVCATRYVIIEDRSALLGFYKRMRRRWDSLSIALAGAGLVGGGWFVAAAWGAWAIKAFAGEHVARALFLRHERMPWRYWLNLPLIPLTLILARTPLIDSLLPFLPLTLVLSTHASPHVSDPLGLDNLALTYPPSPTLLLCALPWIRLLYLRARHRVFSAVLGRRRQVLDGFAGVLAEMQAIDDGLDAVDDAGGGAGAQPAQRDAADAAAQRDERGGGGRFQVVAEVQVEELILDGAGAAAGDNVAAAPPPGGGAAIVQNRLRVGLGRLTSLVVGALLFPAICSISGSVLFWFARRGGARPSSSLIKALRNLLGVQAVIAARYATQAQNGSAKAASTWLQTILLPSSLSPNMMGGKPIDPVWLRNALGGGLALVARDAVELITGIMEIRRKKSRRIMGRDFGDGLELDDGTTARGDSAASATMSGGRDRTTGREARAHPLL